MQLPLTLPAGNRGINRALELLVFALAVPLCGAWLSPSDPLGLHAGFPWAAAGPIIFAARYGSRWGFACSVLAALATAYPFSAYAAEQQSSLSVLAVGTLIMSIVVGDAASAWRKRSRRAEAENLFLQRRLQEFSRDYHVLKVSHGQLEEFLAGQRMSLREALQQLESVWSQPGGEALMALFAQFCSVQVAGLYPMKNAHRVNSDAIVTLGDMGDLPIFDPLLKLAVEQRQVISLKQRPQTPDAHKGGLLAVVPIVDAGGHLHAVLAIRDMHFLAFQQRNLDLLALLGAYLGDLFTRSHHSVASGHDSGLDEAGRFAENLDTAVRFSQQHGVQSSLLCLELKEFAEADAVARLLATGIRGLDSSWIPESEAHGRRVAILLPLMPIGQCDALLRRVSVSVRETFDLELQAVLRSVRRLSIGPDETRDTCLAFVVADSDGTESDVQHTADATDVGHAA